MGDNKKNRNYTNQTIKMLFALSGNQCAFYGCSAKLIEQNSNYSNICHIYGLTKDSLRYNPNLSVKEANEYSNLILLCPSHHSMVDDKNKENKFTPEYLFEMKRNHENTVSPNKSIKIQQPIKIDKYDFKKLIDNSEDYYAGYDILYYSKLNNEKIKENIKKIFKQSEETRLVLYKLISYRFENRFEKNFSLKLNLIFNEIEIDFKSFLYQLKILCDLDFVKEIKYIGDMESLFTMEDGYLYDVSEDYNFKFHHGEWGFTEKSAGLSLLLDYYFKSLEIFYNFLVEKNMAVLSEFLI